MIFKQSTLAGNSSFLKVGLVSAGNVLNAVMGFFFLTAVAKTLDLSTFGKYALLTSLLTLVGRLIDFGTNSIFVSSDSKEINTKLFLISKIYLFVFSVPISISLLYIFKLSSLDLVLVFLVGLIAYGLNFTLYALYQKTQQFLELVLLNTVPSVIKVVYGIAILSGNYPLNLTNAFAIFGFSIFSDIFIIFFMRVKGVAAETAVNTGPSAVLNFIWSAVSPGVSLFIYEGWSTLNNILTKIYNTFSDVGIFSMANKISSIFTLISFSVFTVLLPKNAQRKINRHSYDFYETAILTLAMLVLAIAAVVISEMFLTTVFGTKFEKSIKFLDILIFASAITAAQNFIENYFFVEEKTNVLIKINVLKLALLVVISAAFIPIFGLISLAYANLISALVGIFLTTLYIKQIEAAKS